MAREEHNAIYLNSEVVGAHVVLPFIDRIRLLFGSRLFVNVLVETQRRQKIRTQTRYGIEAVFGSNIPKDKLPNLFDGSNEYFDPNYLNEPQPE